MELLNILDMVNEIESYSFGIVDTYGAMYLEDIIHYYNVVDYNLKPNNIIYLTEKYRLSSKDIKYIISSIVEKTKIWLR